MTAYLIARVEVSDPQSYAEYTKRIPDAIAAFGGWFVVRGGARVTLEGPEETRRLVVIAFPSMERLKAFWDSAAYADAKRFRLGAAQLEAVAVEGV
jgi:uncharacterized protein (DUF1330 family)